MRYEMVRRLSVPKRPMKSRRSHSMLSELFHYAPRPRGTYLHQDAVNDVRAVRRAPVAITNGGAIPDTGDIESFEPSETFVGRSTKTS